MNNSTSVFNACETTDHSQRLTLASDLFDSLRIAFDFVYSCCLLNKIESIDLYPTVTFTKGTTIGKYVYLETYLEEYAFKIHF